MSRRDPRVRGLPDEAWGRRPKPRRRPTKVHLKSGPSSGFPGPACGQDFRVERRGHEGSAFELTDDPNRVTCEQCKRSYEFRKRLE